ncbi:hypothetical protein L6452_44162 [Arctium lappa]|uniref:Uncharacterized protein n=1 Tax=Arctium lappa TaxID=4217 RepID=A0ACB8XG48_ARCLA|nr:hypothetical protein L6452_44162 [Arctium lappa]
MPAVSGCKGWLSQEEGSKWRKQRDRRVAGRGPRDCRKGLQAVLYVGERTIIEDMEGESLLLDRDCDLWPTIHFPASLARFALSYYVQNIEKNLLDKFWALDKKTQKEEIKSKDLSEVKEETLGIKSEEIKSKDLVTTRKVEDGEERL